jgi:hypothetical protein
MHLMEPLGDMGQVESRFDPFWDIFLSDQDGRFAPNTPSAHKSICTHQMGHLSDEAQVEARFGIFGDSANHDTR